MEKKINQRVALTKRLVHEGLLRLLEKEPVESINVSELCREAGINRATFYKHYYSPHDVLAEVEANFVMELDAAQFSVVPKEVSTHVTRLEGLCTYLKNNSKTVTLLVKSKMDSDLSKIFETFPNDAVKVLERNIRFDDKQKYLVTRFLSFGLYGLILRWIIEDIPLTPREVALLIDDLSKGGWLI